MFYDNESGWVQTQQAEFDLLTGISCLHAIKTYGIATVVQIFATKKEDVTVQSKIEQVLDQETI